MKESAKWWGILLISVTCVWLSTHLNRETSLLGKDLLEYQDSMLSQQGAMSASIDRINVTLKETREKQIRLLKEQLNGQRAIMEILGRLEQTPEKDIATISQAEPQISVEDAVPGGLTMNIEEAAAFYEHVAGGVENLKERVSAYRQTLNEEETEVLQQRMNDALDVMIANAELADQYTPEELKGLRESMKEDESMSFLLSAVEEGVLGQMLIQADATGPGDISFGFEIEKRNE